MGIFGSLTYRNIRQTRVLIEQNVDRQLVRMTLFQVMLVGICLGPYSINSVYTLTTEKLDKSTNRVLIENFISTIMVLVTYSYYSVCLFPLCHINFLNYSSREVATCF